MLQKHSENWEFIDEEGTFTLSNPHHTSTLYFPLVNETGFTAVVTPTLHGDIKADYHTYLTPPVSIEDLHMSRAARNFWVALDDQPPWSATGNSAWQTAQHFTAAEEDVRLQSGLLWHQVTRENQKLGLRAEITNLVPTNTDRLELMRVVLTNISDSPLTFTPTTAIPIFGRSAVNQHDHRHVTSLLQRIHTHPHGVLVKPSLSFDERGHRRNTVTYAVLGSEGDGRAPAAFFPIIADFIGEGGTLDWPQAVVLNQNGLPAGTSISGYEALGGLRFASVTLPPGERRTYILQMAISLNGEIDWDKLVDQYGSQGKFTAAMAQNTSYWQEKVSTLKVKTGDSRFDQWLQWVTLQPSLRRLCGNSFLPYHDYGRGGRGWRDLWQDLLALLLMEPDPVRELLFNNFAGVRLDGSNATIVGSLPGEFKADRNNIPRVWMDHGAWPWLTTRLYLEQTGDLDFLLQSQTYFKDNWTHRAQAQDPDWQAAAGIQQRTVDNGIYEGTILEHLLVQHLAPFFNVGEHNIIRLEGADWNDGLDMAAERGESVAFTALYAGNLRQISQVIRELAKGEVTETAVAGELLLLLDTQYASVDYTSVTSKQQRLAEYFEAVKSTLSGDMVTISLAALAADLDAKADWLTAHLRQQEWLTTQSGYSWYNGYYNNDGKRVEGDHENGPRLTLTGQTFALLGGIVTDRQIEALTESVDKNLYDKTVGGHRLNTDFGGVMLNLGRAFGFAFGHKENGSMFSHMAVMYAYALYQHDRAQAGYQVLNGIYQHNQNFNTSRIYPGIPEYVNERGRGMYPYLTGSASWYLLTVVTEMFGVKGSQGDLMLAPKIVAEQFDSTGAIQIQTLFAGRRLALTYHNLDRLDFGQYQIASIQMNSRPISFAAQETSAIISREELTKLDENRLNHLDVDLARR